MRQERAGVGTIKKRTDRASRTTEWMYLCGGFCHAMLRVEQLSPFQQDASNTEHPVSDAAQSTNSRVHAALRIDFCFSAGHVPRRFDRVKRVPGHTSPPPRSQKNLPRKLASRTVRPSLPHHAKTPARPLLCRRHRECKPGVAQNGSGANLIGGHRGSGSTLFITLPTLPPRQRTYFYL